MVTEVEVARSYRTGELPFRTWRTWQMSDHLPMWVQPEVDGADEHLARAAAT